MRRYQDNPCDGKELTQRIRLLYEIGGEKRPSRTKYLTGEIERGYNTVTDVISILWFNGISFNHSPSYITTPLWSNWIHPSHTAYHLTHHPPNDCLLQFSTILEHFRSRVQSLFTYRVTIKTPSIISHSKPEITRFHDATLTKQQIVRLNVLSFSNTSTTYSVNHTSLQKRRQVQ